MAKRVKPPADQAGPVLQPVGTVNHLRIGSIRFLSMGASTRDRVETVLPSDVSLVFRLARPRIRWSSTLLACECDFAAEVVEKLGSDPIATVTATAEVVYIREPASDIAPDAQLKDFLEAHSGFAAWAYWRELASSASLRMGLPPILVPLIDMAAVKERIDGTPSHELERIPDGSSQA